MNNRETDKQRRYAYNRGKGMPSFLAAKDAGYSDSFARVAAHRLGKRPAVLAAIDSIQQAGRAVTVYDLATAMREAGDAADFAISKGNAMALVKARELRAKLSGLLIDRVEVIPVNLSGALEAAERRVINITPRGAGGDLAGPVRWTPHIPGDPVVENPEAGPADGESGSSGKNVGPEKR